MPMCGGIASRYSCCSPHPHSILSASTKAAINPPFRPSLAPVDSLHIPFRKRLASSPASSAPAVNVYNTSSLIVQLNVSSTCISILDTRPGCRPLLPPSRQILRDQTTRGMVPDLRRESHRTLQGEGPRVLVGAESSSPEVRVAIPSRSWTKSYRTCTSRLP